MNFYKHYIGDFQRDTGHLSLVERGAYRAMLDHFYATERPLPTDALVVARLVGAMDSKERAAVARVLKDFWTRTTDGYINSRALLEIQKAAAQRDINREIGKRGGRPPKNRNGSDGETEPETEPETESVIESVPKPEPNRNPNQTPDKRLPTSSGETPSIDGPSEATKRLFDLGVRVLSEAGQSERAARAFVGKVRQAVGDEKAIVLLLAAQKTTDPAAYITKAVRSETTRRVTLC